MYLRESADGPFVTLISFFRVVLSPNGRGHAAFLLLDPAGAGTSPVRPNLCITDNEPLARYLCAGFVRHFAAFKGAAGLAPIRLTWAPLGEAFMVEVPREKSATGQHEMLSLFVNASGMVFCLRARTSGATRGCPAGRDGCRR